MTTNQTNIPEPTSPTAVVVGNRNGETAMAVRTVTTGSPWMLRAEGGCWVLRTWGALCRELTDIRVVPVAEVATEIDQLKARIRELEAAKPEPEPEWAGDQVVMVRFRKYSGNGWTAAYRADDGKWTLHGHGPGLSTDDLADLYEVRRLSPAAHAELLATVRGEQA